MKSKFLITQAAIMAAACALAMSACQQSSLMNARTGSTTPNSTANSGNSGSDSSSNSGSNSSNSGSDSSGGSGGATSGGSTAEGGTSTSTTTSTSTSSGGASYYVSTTGSDSSGNGSKTSPWATIAHASTQVGAGATVYVAPGVYKASFSTNASGTASAYITYAASTADFSGTVNCAQVAAAQGDLSTCARLVGTSGTTWSNNGNYVAIEGFDVSGPGLNGIYTQGTGTIISGNHVHDVLTGTCNSTGGSGINLNGTNAQVIGNYVHNIGPYPSSCGFVQGIYFLQNGGYAYNNISFNNSGFGIQLWHYPSNIGIFNNTIFDNGSGGIVLGTDDSLTVDYITVANNIVVNNGGPGVSEQGASSSSTGVHNVYENNLVEGNSGGSFSLMNGLKAVATITSAPQFVNGTGNASGNYHLLSTSPAIGAGNASGAPSSDFDGNPRPQGGPIDIGAYQQVSSSSGSGSGSTAPTPSPTTAPTITISPTSLSFPRMRHGSTSAIKYATVSNTGGSTLTFAHAYDISGPFAFGGMGTCTLSLPVHTSCTISVVFKPNSRGHFSGAVTLTDNAGNGTQQIPLSGYAY